MYHVSAQGIDERMINVHYYYYLKRFLSRPVSISLMLGEKSVRPGWVTSNEINGS